MRGELRTLALLLALVCASPPRAFADDPEAGKRAYLEGERLFRLSRFAEAIAAYEQAYALDAYPAFLFNIALSHRRQFELDGDRERLVRARHLYRSYLQLEPASPKRAAIEQAIRELTERIDASTPPAPPAAAEPPPPPPTTPPPPPTTPPPQVASPPPSAPAVAATPPRPSRKRWYIVGGVVGGAVVLGGAIALGVVLSHSGPGRDGPVVDFNGH